MASSERISTDGAAQEASQPGASVTALDVPSVNKVLSGLSDIFSSLQERGASELEIEKQEAMFNALKNVIERTAETTEAGSSFDLKELHASLGQAEGEARLGSRDAKILESVHTTLLQLWSCNSQFMAQAAEILANGSRERKSILELFRTTFKLTNYQNHGEVPLGSLESSNSSWTYFLPSRILIRICFCTPYV